MTLTPDQFRLLCRYTEATALLAAKTAVSRYEECHGERWAAKEAEAALEKALVTPSKTILDLCPDEIVWRERMAAAAEMADKRCQCNCADRCALGRAGSMDRCTLAELTEHGRANGWTT